MARKAINLGVNLRFDSVESGKTHFDKILKDTLMETHVTPQEFREISALYVEYCRRTNWQLTSKPTAFYPTYARGPGYTTKCFAVRFEDGSEGRFSLDKALRAVAE